MTWQDLAARRILIPAAGLLAGFVCFVPLSAAFHQADIGWGLRALIIGLTALAALAPAWGLMALSLLLPMTLIVASLGDWVLSPAQLTDACLLAVASGASLRLNARRGPDERLAGLAIAFGAAVLTSVVVDVHQLNVIAPQRPVWDEVWHHLTIDFWRAPREFPVLHDGARWLAGLALAVYAERVLRAAPRRGPTMTVAWILGGTAGAVITAARLVEEVTRGGLSVGAVVAWVLHVARLSVLQPDLNAAGSYFALFLAPALIVGWRRRRVWMLAVSAPLVLLAFTLARSRAAIGAVVAVAGAHTATQLRRPPLVRLAIGIVAIAVGVPAALALTTSRSHVALEEAGRIRVQMAQVAVSGMEHHPVFGVGLGEYIPRTRRFVTDDMALLRGFAPNGENAHDNFLQVLVELGIPAGLAFLWLVGSAALAGWTRPRADRSPEGEGMALGLLAFSVSAFFGNPLLVPEMFGVFALALGLTAGVAMAPGRADGRWRWCAQALTGFYLISLVWRVW